MNRQQKNIQSAISRNEKMIYKLKTDRATWEKSERELARQSRQIEDMINKTVSKTGKTTSITTTANFVRPVGGPCTSPYGTRIHPIFKKQIFHSGVDIGAPYGANVKAANSGKVIFTGWYGGYGKVVIIDHGKVGGRAYNYTICAPFKLQGCKRCKCIQRPGYCKYWNNRLFYRATPSF